MLIKAFDILLSSVLNLFSNGNIEKDRWIFSSTDNDKFNYNSKVLFEYVLREHPEIKPQFIINNKEERIRLQNLYGKRYFSETTTVKGKLNVLRAGVWFTSAGLPVYEGFFRPPRIVINLWHGVPLKKIALAENSSNPSILKKALFRFLFSRVYDYVVTTSDRLIPIMQESFSVERDKIVCWGQPRNDLLVNKSKSQPEHDKITDLLSGLPSFNKIVLYAPTFRDKKTTKLFPFDDMDFGVLSSFLERKKIIIAVRLHQSELQEFEAESDRIIPLNSDIVSDINSYLSSFDCLITDYSSIYIDFLLLNRPMLFLPYDKNDYLKDRGLNFDYELVTPGPKPENLDRFLHYLENIEDLYKKYRTDIERVNSVLNGDRINSCELIIREVKGKL